MVGMNSTDTKLNYKLRVQHECLRSTIRKMGDFALAFHINDGISKRILIKIKMPSQTFISLVCSLKVSKFQRKGGLNFRIILSLV